jgi:hypothetical protein
VNPLVVNNASSPVVGIVGVCRSSFFTPLYKIVTAPLSIKLMSWPAPLKPLEVLDQKAVDLDGGAEGGALEDINQKGRRIVKCIE